MRKWTLPGLAAALSLLAAAPSAWPAWTFSASPDLIRAHMAYLASDELQGRDAGLPGYDLAAAYAAKQFQDMGLKPGGDNGTFLQHLTLIRDRALPGGTLKIVGPKGTVDLVEGPDFRNSATAHGRDVTLNAPAVFAGFGVVAAGQGRDDFKGLNVRGKIVVVLDGSPEAIPAADRNFVASAGAKAMMAKRLGAVGLIVIAQPAPPPPPGRGPAQAVAAGAAAPPAAGRAPAAPPTPPNPNAPGRAGAFGWTWELPGGDANHPGVPVLATVTPAGAAKLFAGTSQTYEALLAASKSPAANPARFNLPGRIEAVAKGELGERRPSENVIAMIEGSDPNLKSQYIVMSGHLDHLGVSARPLPNGDAINNGALDNAGGVSTLIEAARGFATGPRPRRSVIFLLVTGEEKGLIGSSYFTNNPVVPKASIVADVNLDMPVMTYDFVDVAAIGAEHSNIIQAVNRAAGRMNIGISPDPVPRLGIFTRSDHYNFVLQGIPAVFLIGGFKNGGEVAFNDFYDNRYHKPGDDLNQAIDYNVAAKWAHLNYEIAWELANQPKRPMWNKNDLFGSRYAAPSTVLR